MSILPDDNEFKDKEIIVQVVNVYDGDTLTVNIDGYPSIIGKNIGVRIAGIDTPEIRTKNIDEKKAGYEAKEAMRKIIQGVLTPVRRVTLENLRRDKYFRILADVYADGRDVGQAMINEGHARHYWGGTKKPWFTEE